MKTKIRREEYDSRKIAKLMISAPIFDWGEVDGKLADYLEVLDVEDAKKLGVVFANGNGYHSISDIRSDEINDGWIEMLARAIDYAFLNYDKGN